MENYKKAIKGDKYIMKPGIRGKQFQSQNEAHTNYLIINSKPIKERIFLNQSKIIISGSLENRNENKYYENNINNNHKISKQEENHREKQEMHAEFKRPQSYKFSQNNRYNPNIINNNRKLISSIEPKEMQRNKNIPNNYQRIKIVPKICYSIDPQIIFNNHNDLRNIRKPQEMNRSLLNKPENKTNLQQLFKEKNQNRGVYNRKDLEEVSLQTPSKEESRSKMNLIKGAEISNKIESSNKKGKTANDFNKKKNLVKKCINLDFKLKINKEEKNKENLNENIIFRTKPFRDKSKDSKEIQNDIAEKKIMELNIINNKYESEIESLRKENLELKNQINENKISISIKENQIKTKDLEIKKKDDKIRELNLQVENNKRISELNLQLEKKIESIKKENIKKDGEIEILNLKMKKIDLNANDIDELKEDLKNKNEIILIKESEIKGLQEKIGKVSSDLKKLQLENEKLKKIKQNNFNIYKSENILIQNEKEIKEKDLNEKILILEEKEKLESHQNKIEADKKYLTDNYQNLQKEIKNLSDQKIELENQIKDLNQQKNNLSQNNFNNINSNLMNVNNLNNMNNMNFNINNNMNFNLMNNMNNKNNFINNNPMNNKLMNINNINNNMSMSNLNNNKFIFNKNLINNNIINNNNNFNQNNNNNNLRKSNRKKPLYFYKNPTLIGLQNIGATSFMNATLECLSQIEDLTNYFLDENRSGDKIKNNNIAKKNENLPQLSPVYLELVKKLWDKNIIKGSYSPNKFMKTIETMNPLFKLGQAGDSKDFIIFLLEQFHNELRKVASNNNNYDKVNEYDQKDAFMFFFRDFSKQTSIISDIFFGIQENTNICLFCKKNYSSKGQPYPICYNYQIFNCLIFPLEEIKKMKNQNNIGNYIDIIQNNEVNLDDCFIFNEKTELFTGDNRNFCNICRQLWDSHYTSKIYSCPNVLVLILNRGKNNTHNVKLNFQETIDITKFVSLKDGKVNYILTGVITHYGQSGPNSHFLAFCRSPIDNQWYRYNDAIVTEVKDVKKDIIDFGNPYILFYKKVDLDSIKG